MQNWFWEWEQVIYFWFAKKIVNLMLKLIFERFQDKYEVIFSNISCLEQSFVCFCTKNIGIFLRSYITICHSNEDHFLVEHNKKYHVLRIIWLSTFWWQSKNKSLVQIVIGKWTYVTKNSGWMSLTKHKIANIPSTGEKPYFTLFLW